MNLLALMFLLYTHAPLPQVDFSDTAVGADLDGQDWQAIIITEAK